MICLGVIMEDRNEKVRNECDAPQTSAQKKGARLRSLMAIASKRFAGLNKGSRLLLKIASTVFLFSLTAALFLLSGYSAGFLRFEGQMDMIQWIVLYFFRFFIILTGGAFALDLFVSRKSSN